MRPRPLLVTIRQDTCLPSKQFSSAAGISGSRRQSLDLPICIPEARTAPKINLRRAMGTTVVRFEDSDGYEHFVCAQSQAETCGAASLFMIECYVKAMSMASGEDGVRKYLGRSDSTWADGMYLGEAVQVLKSFGCQPRIDQCDVRS